MNDSDRFEMYERVHLRSKADLPLEEKIPKLQNKYRSKWFQIVLNIVIILGLGYAYTAGYRPFKDWVYYVLAGIFVLNVVLLFVQKNQIQELIDHLESSGK